MIIYKCGSSVIRRGSAERGPGVDPAELDALADSPSRLLDGPEDLGTRRVRALREHQACEAGHERRRRRGAAEPAVPAVEERTDVAAGCRDAHPLAPLGPRVVTIALVGAGDAQHVQVAG